MLKSTTQNDQFDRNRRSRASRVEIDSNHEEEGFFRQLGSRKKTNTGGRWRESHRQEDGQVKEAKMALIDAHVERRRNQRSHSDRVLLKERLMVGFF